MLLGTPAPERGLIESSLGSAPADFKRKTTENPPGAFVVLSASPLIVSESNRNRIVPPDDAVATPQLPVPGSMTHHPERFR
jgi:hypothetical protein